MRKILISILCVFVGFSTYATGENIPTSKNYVDSAVAQKQDKIPANNGTTQILMNTGTDGSVGTKNIYDSTGEYGTQTESLVTAEQFNTAVQNAIDSEFECVGWNPNDSTDCWFVHINPVVRNTGIGIGDGEWFRAFFRRTTQTWWHYYPDASSSIRIPIKPNQSYRLYWDDGYHPHFMRVAFAKTDDVPTPDGHTVALYKANGTAGYELVSDDYTTHQSLSFAITDNTIKYIVIQIPGWDESWTNGDFSVLWDRISHLHLQVTNWLPES